MGAGACRDQSSALLVEDFLAGPNNQAIDARVVGRLLLSVRGPIE